MNAETLVLKSVTGVNVELQIAGPGSRSFAFIIDWHIRLIFALIWFITAMTAMGLWGQGVVRAFDGFWQIVLLPPVIIYFFYQPVVELIMRGRSPGKRIAGVRVVTRQGEIPSFGAILLRNVFRLLDSLPSFYALGLAMVIITSRHVRLGDMASGTLLVIDATESEQSFDVLSRGTGTGTSPTSAQAFELVHELLERWTALELTARNDVARALLTKIDPGSAASIASSSSSDLQERLRAVLTQGSQGSQG